MLNARQDLASGGAIGPEFISHEYPRHVAQTFQQLAKEAFRRPRVATIRNQYIEHVPMLINGSPEVVQFTPDADKHLIQEPPVAGLRPAPFEAVGAGSPEAQAPLTDSLLADHDASRRQNQLDFAQAEAEAMVEPNRLVDNFSWETEAPVGLDVVLMPQTLNSGQPDSTPGRTLSRRLGGDLARHLAADRRRAGGRGDLPRGSPARGEPAWSQ
jgi:hypothetical protein